MQLPEERVAARKHFLWFGHGSNGTEGTHTHSGTATATLARALLSSAVPSLYATVNSPLHRTPVLADCRSNPAPTSGTSPSYWCSSSATPASELPSDLPPQVNPTSVNSSPPVIPVPH